MAEPRSANAVALSPAERETLRCVAGHVIPASDEFSVAGADDAAIFADVVNSLGRDASEVQRALRLVDAAAGGRLAAVAEAERAALLADFRAAHPALAAVVGGVIARGYYRDDRVMISIGMEVRPPFPHGFELEQGDWSILDPVRARGRKYRDADTRRGT